MKVISTRTVFNTAVGGESEAILSATKQETDEFRQALAVVGRWEKEVRRALKFDPKIADFHMFSFAVKTDKVIATLTAGANG